MNRYFVFKKVRSVDAKKMAEVILKEGTVNPEEKLEEVEEVVEPPIKKKQRLVLKKAKPVEVTENVGTMPKGPNFTGEKAVIKIKR
jgi:hypothetical protein